MIIFPRSEIKAFVYSNQIRKMFIVVDQGIFSFRGNFNFARKKIPNFLGWGLIKFTRYL